MSQVLRYSRIGVGVLTLGTGVPLLAIEWSELSQERDDLAAEVDLLRSRLEYAAAVPARGSTRDLPLAYAGRPLLDDQGLAIASEQTTLLQTESASLRRELDRLREAPPQWQRGEGDIGLLIEPPSPPSGESRDAGLELDDTVDVLRRRLVGASRDLEDVQADRDEALAMLRREMFNNLQFSAVIGECGHRLTSRSVNDCADRVRALLAPEWSRFDACVREVNAVPTYSQAEAARNVANALQLERGAILMCDPGLPEGGRPR